MFRTLGPGRGVKGLFAALGTDVGLLKTLGRTDVPVTVGARRPLAQPVRYSAKVHGSDGLGEIPIDRDVRVRTDISAAEQLVTPARQHPGELEIMVTGPLTNIAMALMIEPELPNLIAGISVMGGAVTVPGNNTPWAESKIRAAGTAPADIGAPRGRLHSLRAARYGHAQLPQSGLTAPPAPGPRAAPPRSRSRSRGAPAAPCR
ncbi:nucleoside hydrolase [Streptomyces sp. Inha503]|uniref:nucleoside hydrolase n=1 Tax=Streptomyces sp. Inha503 TaxID=3383314 RepID=UPI00399F5FBE